MLCKILCNCFIVISRNLQTQMHVKLIHKYSNKEILKTRKHKSPEICMLQACAIKKYQIMIRHGFGGDLLLRGLRGGI